MRLIDTHCHLNDLEAFPDVRQTIDEAREAGVERIAVIGIDEASSRYAVELADQHPEIIATAGWHPTHVATWSEPRDLSILRELLSHPKCLALGEIGLDYHWDYTTPEQQDAALRAQLDLADELGKPVIFHCREAYPSLLTLLEARGLRTPAVLHCFAGDLEDARRAEALGLYLGFDGPITYAKAEVSRQVAAQAPADRILIETDAPYLTPIPHRGKPNRPAWVRLVAQRLAEVRGWDLEQAAAQTTANAERFYGLSSVGP